MNDLPVNNGKDVRSYKTHKQYSIDGVHQNIKSPIIETTATPYEPKRNNRWLINFKGSYKNIPQWSLKKSHRPKLVNGKWTNFKITLRDVIGPSTTQAVIDGFRGEWQNKHNKIPEISYLLEMLDPTGVTIEKWEIDGEVIKADFGKLNYAKDKLTEIKLEIKPSKVMLLY